MLLNFDIYRNLIIFEDSDQKCLQYIQSRIQRPGEGGVPRNMKSMRPPLVVIFFMTNFDRVGGGGMAPLAPMDPLLTLLFSFRKVQIHSK